VILPDPDKPGRFLATFAGAGLLLFALQIAILVAAIVIILKVAGVA